MTKGLLVLFSLMMTSTMALALGGSGDGNGGGQETNGGDGVVAQYIMLFDEMMRVLPNKIIFQNGRLVDKKKLIESKAITVYSSIESLNLYGIEKGAVNKPYITPPRIVIGRKFWNQLDLEGRRLLILHEQLFIAGFDDKDYSFTTGIYDRLLNGRTYSLEVLTESIQTCEQDFFDRLGKSDFEYSFNKEQQDKALYSAIFSGCETFVKLWTDWGQDVNQCRMVSPISALMVAPIPVFAKRLRIAQMLLNAGASANLGCTLPEQNACKVIRNQFAFPQNEILENLIGCRR